MRNFHESLKVSQDSVNPLRAFVHEGAPLLSRPFAEQTTMFESYSSLLPISIHSLIARPPHPALCEMIIIHYDSHGVEYLGGDRGWKFDELFSLGLAGIQDSLGISKYQSSDDETNLPPIKHWRLLWGNEWDPIEHHSYDMLFIICIEWQSQEARATFLQRDDVRAILRKHGMPDEDSDDDYGTIGAKEYEDELSAFLMANEAIKCQRSLCDVTQIEATQSWCPTSSAQRLGCIIL